jgi:hypothetical protein
MLMANTAPRQRHQGVATARPIPPKAMIATTTRGGARHTVRSMKPTKTSPKSPRALTALVHTGL